MRLGISLWLAIASMTLEARMAKSAEWLISTEHAECLAIHLDAYLQVDADPVIIFLEACPIADMEEAMDALRKNLTQPKIRHQPALGLDAIIVYSKVDLACLKRAFPNTAGVVQRLPKIPECGNGG